MLRLGRVEFRLGLTPEFLATLIANQTAGDLARLERWTFFRLLFGCGGFDFFEGLVLVHFEPFESTLD